VVIIVRGRDRENPIKMDTRHHAENVNNRKLGLFLKKVKLISVI